MRQGINHREVFARQETLGEHFAIIFKAVVGAFRLSGPSPGCRRTPIHYAGFR